MRFFLPFFLLIIFCSEANAQVNWEKLSDSIRKGKDLADLNEHLQTIRLTALNEKEYSLAGRCYQYQLQIADRKTEDTLFFHNSTFMDSMLQHPNTPALLRSVMHVLKAKRIVLYRNKFFYKGNKNLVRDREPDFDYARLSQFELDSISNHHFEQAKRIGQRINEPPVDQLLWLATDPLLFLFKPGYADIIFAEEVQHSLYRSKYADAAMNGDWLSMSPTELMYGTQPISGFNRGGIKMLELYRMWIGSHTGEPEIQFFLETLARKYFYQLVPENTTSKKLYEQYLETGVQSPYSAVKVNCVYQLGLFWNSEAGKYSNNVYDYKTATWQNTFNETYRMHYVKTRELINRHLPLLDSFRYLKKILIAVKQKMETKTLDMEADYTQLPGEPVSVLVKFKNTTQLNMRVVALHHQFKYFSHNDSAVLFYNSLPAVYEKTIPLPAAGDFQLHKANIQLPALSAGNYAVEFSDTGILNTPGRVNFVKLSVSNISIINNDQRVFVLNRKTGFPLAGAKAEIVYGSGAKNYDKMKKVTATVNREGYIVTEKKDVYGVSVYHQGDTALLESVNEINDDGADDEYDSDDDDLLDYYDNHLSLRMFTDRGIYRPGQTVFFKGIVFTRNRVTGEDMVLNRKNLKFPLLKKMFNAEVRDFMNQKYDIDLLDPFNRKTDSLIVTLNDYGSFTGRFKIPENAATGDWEFDNEYLDNNQDGRFRVEEYKRPSFEISLEKPKVFLQLGDPFEVKVNLKSFAGATLDNALVKYRLLRNTNIPADSLGSENGNKELAKGEIYTNSMGVATIVVNDSVTKRFLNNATTKYYTDYRFEVEAIDGTGESHKAEDFRVMLSNRPVKIDYNLGKMVERSQFPFLPIITKSEFSGILPKQVVVKIFKLPVVETLPGTNNRWWLGTGQYFLQLRKK
jgi:alpha-2-macroglobulin